MEKINQPDNILEIEKVNRYMQFVELIAKLKQDINTSMLAIERTWNFKVDYIEDINDDDLI